MNKTIKAKAWTAKTVATFCEAKTLEKTGKRQAESAKTQLAVAFVGDTLAMERGDVIQLDAGKYRVNIERVDKTRFDIDAFRIAHPDIAEKFTKPATEYHFKPIVLE